MGEIRIRIDDEALMVRLSDLAREHGQSLEQEAADLLKSAVEQQPRAETFYEAARRIAAMTPKDRPQPDSVEILRELRDR